MATEKAALRVTELDFLSIRDNLKEFLRSQNEFTDYDFEGSGMAVLLDVLAYNTHYMGYYLNMVGNEMFLDTAQLRSSILSHAKLTNYVPGSMEGALNKVNIVITPSGSEDQTATNITLDKYTRLLGTDIDGINYPFVTLYSNTAIKANGQFAFSNVNIKQGEVITLQYAMTADNDARTFNIPSANVDTTSLAVVVQESASNTYQDVYTLAEDITEITSNTKVYFIEENEDQTYNLYFGDDVIGKKPKVGNIVQITYLDNVGVLANNISKFVFSDLIAGKYQDNVVVTATQSSYGGIDKESIEQVRYRAPYFYSTQNRAVIETDYETLLTKDYSNIDSVSVWGGEKNDPVVYGKVFISLKTKSNYYLTNLEKEVIKNDLIRKRNVMTITPEIVDPDYTYLIVKTSVSYDPKKTTKTAQEIAALVRAAIIDYSDNELNKFRSVYRRSKLQSYIENCDPSITGSELQVYAQKRIEFETLGGKKSFTLRYELPIAKGNYIFNHKFESFPKVTVQDANGDYREVFFEEVPESFTGISTIDVISPGRNYQSQPTVTILGDGSGATAEAEIINGKVNSIKLLTKGGNYSQATVEITGGGGSEAVAEARIENDFGTLRTYYFKSNGEKVIVNDNAGSIDYAQGKIYINEFVPLAIAENNIYDPDIVVMNVPIDNQTIYPSRNRILTIDEHNAVSIAVDVVAE